MLIGRETEQNKLNNLVNSGRSEFVAVYGRRRIGKTELINKTFTESMLTFKHTGIANDSRSKQLKEFRYSLEKKGYKVKHALNDWADAFHCLEELVCMSTAQKKIIFIDELSWMDTQRSDLVSALEHFYNDFCFARNDIVLIVCCSATSWMLSKIINNKGGLYNRLTERIHLQPFSLRECELYAESENLSLSREQIVHYYMIFGGVPYYWTFLKRYKGMSVYQAVDKLFYSYDADLKYEYEYLFQSIFKNPEHYISIVEALGNKKAGMTRLEIAEISGNAASGRLTVYLDELEKCGFIRSYRPLGAVKKNTLYQLIDNFVLYYFKFVKNASTDEHFWVNSINTPVVNTWEGLAFERVCLQHVPQIKKKLEISGVASENYSLICREDIEKGIFGSQIDLLIQRNDHIINMCEIKYSNAHYTISRDEYEKINRRIHDLKTVSKTKYAIHPILITSYGIVDNQYSSVIQSVVTMNDLFS